MAEKTVYTYDGKKIFSGIMILNDTDRSPSGAWNIPAGCTEIESPAEKPGYVRVWNGEKWEYTEDHRGEKYWLPGEGYDTPGHEVTDIGPLPEGASNTAPQPTEEELRAQKLKELDTEYQIKFDELDSQIMRAAALKDTDLQDELLSEREAMVAEYTEKRGEL